MTSFFAVLLIMFVYNTQNSIVLSYSFNKNNDFKFTNSKFIESMERDSLMSFTNYQASRRMKRHSIDFIPYNMI